MHFGGRDDLIECPRKGEATRNYLLLLLKGLSFLATSSHSVHTGFQVQEKNSPLEILFFCFFGTTNTMIK